MCIYDSKLTGAAIGVGLTLLTSFAAAEQVTELAEVDLELVLAADRSASMSRLMLVSQRNGFAAAFMNEALHELVRAGPLGRIAVVYVEWSDETDQEITVPWTKLESFEDFEKFAGAVSEVPIGQLNRETAIGAALLHSQDLLNTNAFNGRRKVIDISSNGRNSDGPPIREVLRTLDFYGTTVNGLVLPEGYFLAEANDSLTDYFWREVVAGPGGFAITVVPRQGYDDAILRKLLLEIASVSSFDTIELVR